MILAGIILAAFAQTASTPEPRTPVEYKNLPPGLQLGIRAESIRRAWPVAPTVVIVSDEASYIEAIAGWSGTLRYPVLIDDGTPGSREDIARFVRGFKPEQVIRWAREGGAPSGGLPSTGSPPPTATPVTPEQRRKLIESALYRVWERPAATGGETAKIENALDLVKRWNQLSVPLCGVVAADPADPAWPAALALAAGHCQPIAWVSTDSNVNGAFSRPRLEALESAIEAECEKTGIAWKDQGDPIDALTLCLNCPAKVQLDSAIIGATTDMIARHHEKDATGAEGPRDKGKRWAWAGQVFGNQSQSAYRAMCALFLTPRSAWVFDGYPSTKPWDMFDGGQAAEHLRQAGLDVTLDDEPRNGPRPWRSRTAFGVDAGFIAVNTKGMADEFNLEGGQLRPGDVPFLKVPAVVYLVHSWSAAAPAERITVAGRWLERGAYAYLGSTQEPYLTAFLPTPTLAARMVNSFPWGVAVRFDNQSPVWKLATIGDPLITFGPPAPRVGGGAGGEELPLKGGKALTDLLREALTARDFEQGLALLTMLGRDEDAARLAATVRTDEPERFTPDLAAGGVLPAMRARDADTAVVCFARFTADRARDPVLRDALWHACYLQMTSQTPEATLQALRTNLRPDQVGRDAADLTRPIASQYGRDAAIGMLTEARPKSTTDYDRREIDEALKLFTGGPVRK